MSYRRLKRSVVATTTSIIANAVLASVKLAAGLLGTSSALVADAIESFADVASSIIVWRAMVFADRPADESHPYGHGKAETLGAGAVALILLAAAVFIVIDSSHEIADRGKGPAPFTLYVLIGVIIVKVFLARFVSRIGEQIESDAVAADAFHHWSDAITSAAAAIGITISLVGGPRYEVADDWAAIFAAGIIGFNAVRLLRPVIDELMDATPNSQIVRQAAEVARGVTGVREVEKCLARKMGYQFVLDMHIEVDGTMSVADAHELAHLVKDSIRETIPRISEVTIHIEPHEERKPA